MSSSHQEISFSSVLIIHDDDDLAVAHRFDGFWDGIQHLHGAKVGSFEPNNCPNLPPILPIVAYGDPVLKAEAGH